jgi:hypothetical protein
MTLASALTFSPAVPTKKISGFLRMNALFLNQSAVQWSCTSCRSVSLHWTGTCRILGHFFNFLGRISSPNGGTCVLYYTCSREQVVIVMEKCRCRFPNAFAANDSGCRSTGALSSWKMRQCECASVTAASVPARSTRSACDVGQNRSSRQWEHADGHRIDISRHVGLGC